MDVDINRSKKSEQTIFLIIKQNTIINSSTTCILELDLCKKGIKASTYADIHLGFELHAEEGVECAFESIDSIICRERRVEEYGRNA